MYGSFTFYYIQFLRFEGISQQSINVNIDSRCTYVPARFVTTAEYRRRMLKEEGEGAELHISSVCTAVEDKRPASGLRQYTLIKVF